jgi:hypothetical protein
MKNLPSNPDILQVVPLHALGASLPAASVHANPSPPLPSKTNDPAACFGPRFHSMDPRQTSFREPENNEWVVGLYRSADGWWNPVLLWADPKVDLFWDPSSLGYVKPPPAYLKLEDQPKIDGRSGYPIQDGVVTPF